MVGLYGFGKRPIAEPPDTSRILVVRIDELGDVVLTTPLLRELRAFAPHARITLVVKSGLGCLFNYCPYVDAVLEFDIEVKRGFRPIVLPWRATVFGYRLRSQRFDLALLPRFGADRSHATILAYFTGAFRRFGYSESADEDKQVVNCGYDKLLTDVLGTSGEKHEVERGLDVVCAIGGEVRSRDLELWIGHNDRSSAREFVDLDQPYIVFSPTAGNAVLKQWPIDNFVKLGRRILDDTDLSIVVVGGQIDRSLGSALFEALGDRVFDLTGRTKLPELCAVVEGAACFVGNDAGPTHVAAALRTPVVALYGPSCTHRFRPWSADHEVISLDLPCSPSQQENRRDRCPRCIFPEPRCMTGIAVGRVFEAVQRRIEADMRERAYAGRAS